MGNALCMPPVKVDMQTTTFGGQFLSSISMAFVGGFILAFPYIFWEFWRFLKPALKDKEIKNTKFVIFGYRFSFLQEVLLAIFY
jgi:sec-independent protein translocase protein TatC